MRSGTIAFLTGVCQLLWLPALPPPVLWLPLLAGMVLPAVPRLRARPMLLLAAFCAGLFWALLHAQLTLAGRLPAELAGRELTLVGRIASLPAVEGRRTRFDFLAEELEERGQRMGGPGLVRLYWYDQAPSLRVGERWRLRARLRPPRGFSNPGALELERTLMHSRVIASGYVQAGGPGPLAPAAGFPVDRLREALRERIRAALPDHPLAGVVVALAVGDQQGIQPAQWDLFSRTGVTHLMSISGLHVGMVAWLGLLLARFLWRASPGLPLRLPAQKAGAMGAVAAAAGYALLAGFSVPTQRTLLMIAVAMGALWWQRPFEPSRLLAVALLAVLLYDPFAVLAPGFWLSFCAVAAILYGAAGRVGPRRRLAGWGRTQWVVTLGMLPITLLLFARTPLVSPLANLFAIPFVELLVVPLALAGSALVIPAPTLGGTLLWGAAGALEGVWWVLSQLAALPLPYLVLAPPPWAVVCAVAGLAWLLAPRGWPARWVGAIWLLPLLLVRPPGPPPGAVELTLLEVGQGLAAVVRTAGHTLLFDAGPQFGEGDAGRAVIAPFLRARAITAVDILVLSHLDSDHAGGARSLLAEVTVGELVTAAPQALDWAAARPCRRGEGWVWDAVRFEWLNPPADPPPGASENDLSCVLKVTGEGGSLLLTADVEAAAESELVRSLGGRLAATALVVPHHGSLSSSSPPFVAAVHPAFALFSVGYHNRWHFPAAAVVERYRRLGAQILRTDAGGALTLELLPGQAPRLREHRREVRHWWGERGEPAP